MSATGRTEGLREADDFYETPAWVTRAILPHLEVPADVSRIVLDPFAGRGAILSEVVRAGWRVGLCGIEIDETRAREAIRNAGMNARSFEVRHGSSLDGSAWPHAHLVLTNPPYKYAEAAVRRAHAEVVVRGGEAAFLLRLNFLGSEKRSAFHRQFPSDLFVLPRRPSFVISWKCVGDPAFLANQRPRKDELRKDGCGSHGMVGLSSDGVPMGAVPRSCPHCVGDVRRSSSDATEYAWFVWGPMRGGRWSILEA